MASESFIFAFYLQNISWGIVKKSKTGSLLEIKGEPVFLLFILLSVASSFKEETFANTSWRKGGNYDVVG